MRPWHADDLVGIQFGLLLFMKYAWNQVLCQLHYSIPEESKHGTFVGRIAQDLGLEISDINSKMLRIISRDQKEYFQVNLQNGILFVKHAIDREELCPNSPLCIVSIQVIVDKPVQMHRVDVEIEDINDNYPVFPISEYAISIAESRFPGARFPLEGAIDSDFGTNSITNYELSVNDFFTLEFPKYIHQIRSLELVLKKPLDREEISVHNLTLTAFDGGKPKLSGTAQLIIKVEDANDNAPTFNQPYYQCSVVENAAKGTFVIRINATDLDEGKNQDITYKFSKLVPIQVVSLFSLDSSTGEIEVHGDLDYEESNVFEIQVEAVDSGELPLTGHCKVVVTILDINDNTPEITVTSLSAPIPEDAKPGTIVALVSVYDKDSQQNGKVNCHISEQTVFKINPAYTGDFSLTVIAPLDRETKSEYDVIITAKDEGSPALSASITIHIEVSDINDNAPQFLESITTLFIKENNPPGSHFHTVSAIDLDTGQNSFITYSLIESSIDGIPISSYISINPENGNLFSLLSFDHEQIAYFECHIKVSDAGLPPLSSNLALQIFISDTNDNAPVFTPLDFNSDSRVIITIPKSSQPGDLVTKINAVDLDSGYNAWLSYKFKVPPEHGIFGITQHTGEIQLAQPLTEAESNIFRLVVEVADQGEPPMTAVTEIMISLAETSEVSKLDHRHLTGSTDEFSHANIYLVVGICSVSSIFLIGLVSFTVLKWQKYRDEVNLLRENYKICSNTIGSWVYSQQSQYQYYSNSHQAKNDLMVFPPNYKQPTRNEETAVKQGTIILTSCQDNVVWRL
ncbi:hypothetical protein GDO86_005312 [Hymenochirus boettgeri]|uniref:Cadherin domain-containing protein n=1 Tax=Hymenochirus boettgeri TaxID=247094 RepID=A0A8T2J1C9_9PIPI|nr:hypothetical protein GDO86_005312 [Hymenochirus boettgeri]